MTSQVISFSTALSRTIIDFTWGQQRNDVEARSIFGAQAVEVSAPLWTASMTSSPVSESDGTYVVSSWKSLLMQLKGRQNQLALWDIGRPIPLGTMRGTMTLNATANQGDTTLSIIASGENVRTLLAGDMIGLGQSDTAGGTRQVVMVMADAVSSSGGVISISIQPPMRNTIASGQGVSWNMPTALFRSTVSNSLWKYKSGTQVDSFTMNLLEDVRV